MTIQVPADPTLTSRLQPYLRPGEELLWCGKPDPAVVFAPSDLLAIPFGLIFMGFAAAWTLGARSMGAPAPFWMLGFVFLAVGLWLVAGRLIAKPIRKRRTVYGLTTDRVLLLAGSTFRDTPVRGGSMSVRRRRKGRHASVAFEPFGSFYTYGPAMSGPPSPGTGMPTMGTSSRMRVAPGAIVFSDVADPDAMLAAINRAKATAAG